MFAVGTEVEIAEDRKSLAQRALRHLVLWGYFNTRFNKLEDGVMHRSKSCMSYLQW